MREKTSVSENITNVMLSKMLDLTTQRHKVLSNNLANINTPGFRRKDLTFLEEFTNAAKEGIDSVMSFEARVEEDQNAPARNDGNSVQLEREMAEMSKNSLQYQLALKMLGIRMSMERMAITGRSG